MAEEQQGSDAWAGMGTGWAISSTMVGGIAAWGGLGYLADRLLGIGHVFLPIGFLLGAAGSTYMVWLRCGKDERGDG